MIQSDLNFDQSTGETLKRIGQDTVLYNQDIIWKQSAMIAIGCVAQLYEEFTSDDFRRDMKTLPHHPNVWGALFREAAKLGWIKKSGRYVKSERIESHGREIPVWISLIYKK